MNSTKVARGKKSQSLGLFLPLEFPIWKTRWRYTANFCVAKCFSGSLPFESPRSLGQFLRLSANRPNRPNCSLFQRSWAVRTLAAGPHFSCRKLAALKSAQVAAENGQPSRLEPAEKPFSLFEQVLSLTVQELFTPSQPHLRRCLTSLHRKASSLLWQKLTLERNLSFFTDFFKFSTHSRTIQH